MDTALIVSLAISALSLIISIVSTIVAVRSMKTSARIAIKTADIQLNNIADDLCRSHPGLYEFHGITLADLERAGVTPEELTYLVHSFDAAAAYHSMQNTQKVKLSEYRRTMLLHPKVRLIWKKFILGKTLSRGAFSKAVDDCIEEIERAAQPSTESLPERSLKSINPA